MLTWVALMTNSTIPLKLIRSVDDAIQQVRFTQFERGDFVFRGHANHAWKLKPSVFRHYDIGSAMLLESILLQDIRDNRHRPYCTACDSLEHLTLLQHFGVPTRLLDWTLDILVALFFACYDKFDESSNINGRIYICARGGMNNYVFEDNAYERLLHGDAAVQALVERVSHQDLIVFEPVIKLSRMRPQDAVFMLFPFGSFQLDDGKRQGFDLVEYRNRRNEWHRENAGEDTENAATMFLAYMDVASDSKLQILRELDSKYAISAGTMYPQAPSEDGALRYYSELSRKAHEEMRSERGQSHLRFLPRRE